jgi:hypothetical protein
MSADREFADRDITDRDLTVPGLTDRELREALVREIVRGGALGDPAWRAAFADVPRHLFVPYFFTGRPGTPERLWSEDPDPVRRERWLRGVYADAPLGARGCATGNSSPPAASRP